MKMKEINFELEGICPMKQDNPAEVFETKEQPKTREGWMEQAKLKVYRDEKGYIAIPAASILACMKLAASEVGKKMEAKKNRQTIMSAVFVEPNMLSIGKKEYDCIVEDMVTRKGVGGKDTRVMAYRPLIKNWSAKGTISYLDGVSPEFIKNCLELGGVRFGLLSHRPQFGRFTVKKFEAR